MTADELHTGRLLIGLFYTGRYDMEDTRLVFEWAAARLRAVHTGEPAPSEPRPILREALFHRPGYDRAEVDRMLDAIDR